MALAAVRAAVSAARLLGRFLSAWCTCRAGNPRAFNARSEWQGRRHGSACMRDGGLQPAAAHQQQFLPFCPRHGIPTLKSKQQTLVKTPKHCKAFDHSTCQTLTHRGLQTRCSGPSIRMAQIVSESQATGRGSPLADPPLPPHTHMHPHHPTPTHTPWTPAGECPPAAACRPAASPPSAACLHTGQAHKQRREGPR